MGGMGPNNNSMGQGSMGGASHQGGGGPHAQMNGTSASAIHALPASLPSQSSSSALTQRLAATNDPDTRRTMLGEYPLTSHLITEMSMLMFGTLQHRLSASNLFMLLVAMQIVIFALVWCVITLRSSGVAKVPVLVFCNT